MKPLYVPVIDDFIGMCPFLTNYELTLLVFLQPMDPLELMIYLEHPDYNTPPSSGASSQGHAAGSTPAGAGHSNAPDCDDILAFFE